MKTYATEIGITKTYIFRLDIAFYVSFSINNIVISQFSIELSKIKCAGRQSMTQVDNHSMIMVSSCQDLAMSMQFPCHDLVETLQVLVRSLQDHANAYFLLNRLFKSLIAHLSGSFHEALASLRFILLCHQYI